MQPAEFIIVSFAQSSYIALRVVQEESCVQNRKSWSSGKHEHTVLNYYFWYYIALGTMRTFHGKLVFTKLCYSEPSCVLHLNSLKKCFLCCPLWIDHAWFELQRLMVEDSAKFFQVEHYLSWRHFPDCTGHQRVALQEFPGKQIATKHKNSDYS